MIKKVLLGRQRLKEHIRLRAHSQGGADFGHRVANGHAVDGRVTRGRGDQACEHRDGRCLPYMVPSYYGTFLTWHLPNMAPVSIEMVVVFLTWYLPNMVPS